MGQFSTLIDCHEVFFKSKKWGNLKGEVKLQSMIFKAQKIRLNPKDEPFILKIEQVMILFVMQPEAKISIKQDFQISKSQSVFEIWVQFFASELNS